MSRRNHKKARPRESWQTQGDDGRMEPAGAGATGIIPAGTEGNPLLAAALEYAARGWAIVPMMHPDDPGQPEEERGKVPHIKKWSSSGASTDPDQIRRWWRKWPNANVAILCGQASGGLVVFDLDEHGGPSGLDALHDWEAEHGELPETARSITGSGGAHLLYYVDDPMTTFDNAAVMGVDLRADGALAILPPSTHRCGRAYCWEFDPDEVPVAKADENALRFIEAMRPTGNRKGREKAPDAAREGFTLPEVIKEGKRNSTLTSYAGSLRRNGLEEPAIRAVLKDANASRCKPPLADDEVEGIARSVARYQPRQPAKKRFDHVAVGESLVEEYGARMLIYGDKSIPGAPVLTRSTPPTFGWDAVECAVLDLSPHATDKERKEVSKWLKLRAPKVREAPGDYIAFKNGVLNWRTMEWGSHCPDGLVILSVIPHNWNQSAHPVEVVDDYLRAITCGDEATLANIEEMLGECVARANDLVQCHWWWLQGPGANGKSTLAYLIEFIVGSENCGAAQPNQFTDKWTSATLLGKLVNIADDVDATTVSKNALGVVKKAVTGDLLQAEQKQRDPFQFRPHATLICSCNEQPNLADTSEGMERRLQIVPMRARFKAGDGADPHLKEKLATEESAEYVLRLAVEGLRRLDAQGDTTPNDASAAAKAALIRSSNTVKAYLEDAGLARDDLIDKPVEGAYDAYIAWYEAEGLPKGRACTRTTFARRAGAALDLKSEKGRAGGFGKQEQFFRAK